MARPKKNGTYLNVCIETPIYERLVEVCEEAGQSKTTAVERALIAYLDDYTEKQRMLQALVKKEKEQTSVMNRDVQLSHIGKSRLDYEI